MSHFKPRILKALFIHRIAVILRGYLYLARFKVFDRVIAAPVTEFQLVGLRTTGEAYHLMTEADAEYRVFAPELFHKVDNGYDVLGVARAV